MDEKDLVRRTKNSIKAKKSRAEIMRGFQQKGFKLEYADKILAKAKRPKRIITTVFLAFALITFLTAYTIYFGHTKFDIHNPLTGMATNNLGGPGLSIDQIQITPQFISYILNEMGAWQLHKNPLNLEKPMINFQIGEKTFNSEIDKKIDTKAGLNENADIQFNTDKKTLILALKSSNSQEFIRQAIVSGELKVNPIATEKELGLKGYLQLYNSLK